MTARIPHRIAGAPVTGTCGLTRDWVAARQFPFGVQAGFPRTR